MRVRHPERYHSYKDINKLSPIGNVFGIAIVVFIAISLIGGFAYYKFNERETTTHAQLVEMRHLTNSVANLDTETEAIDYVKNSAKLDSHYQIGTPIVLSHSLSSYNKELTGYNYPLVDYFKINNYNYYLRLIYTSNTQEKFQTMLLNKKEYSTYQQFDNLQMQLAKSIKQHNQYNKDIANKLETFKKQHPELHN